MNMTDEEFKKECDKLEALTSKLEYYESLLNETLPGDGDHEYYATQVAALSFMIERVSRPLWKEVARRSPQD